MGMRFELVPPGYLDDHFQKDEAGRTVFYPWRAWGKGRILPDESVEADIRKFLSVFLSVCFFYPIVVGPLFGARYILFAGPLVVLWFHLRTRALVGGLPISETKFTKESFRKRFSRYNKPFSKFTLWLVFASSLLFFSLCSVGAIARLRGELTGESNPLVGILVLVFFGAMTVVSAYRLLLRYGSQASNRRDDEALVRGISILGFKPESTAKKAGMQKGDVIVEYAGTRDLTIEKLLAFIAKTRTEMAERRLVFVRGGHEHTLTVPAGSLGISAADLTIQAASGNPCEETSSYLRPEAANPSSEPARDDGHQESDDPANDQSASPSPAFREPLSGVPDIPIIRSLRNTDQSKASYVWRAWLISFIPSLVIATVVVNLLGLQPYKDLTIDKSPTFWVFGVVLLSPWAETLLMWPILAILKEVFRKQLWVALASALMWGYLHSRFALAWGFPTAWAFFVFSLCFLEWEKKSKSKAIIVTASVHMCQNGVPTLIGLIPLISWG